MLILTACERSHRWLNVLLISGKYVYVQVRALTLTNTMNLQFFQFSSKYCNGFDQRVARQQLCKYKQRQQ
jgi:hypothetical protein